VDEAGDLTLFDKRGRSIVGSEGVSRHFMADLVELPNPNLAPRKLEKLRKRFMTDPYFIGVPSTQPARNTTAVYFHANDNIREVRYEVIKLLPSLGAKATIAIKRKEHLAKLHRLKPDSRVEREAPNTVYDELITEIFRGNLHPVDRVNLVFAERDKRKRRRALEEALDKARRAAGVKQGKTRSPDHHQLRPPVRVGGFASRGRLPMGGAEDVCYRDQPTLLSCPGASVRARDGFRRQARRFRWATLFGQKQAEAAQDIAHQYRLDFGPDDFDINPNQRRGAVFTCIAG
jgi:hypothetical protein